MKKKAFLQSTSQENTMRSTTQRNKALRDIDFQKELRTKTDSECSQLVSALGIHISEHSTCSTVSLIPTSEKEK